MAHLSLQGVRIDRSAGLPLSRQLYESLRDAILGGQLSAQGRMPSTRELAGLIGVSRTTVIQAYEDLRAEGYLIGRQGSGTYVGACQPEQLPRPRSPRATGGSHKSRLPRVSGRGRTLLETATDDLYRTAEGTIHPFVAGVPSLADFPYHTWSRMLRRQLTRLPRRHFSYGDPAGFPPLRESIAAHLRAARAVRADADQVIVLNGSQESFALIAHCLADPGDTALIEDPPYRGAFNAYRVQGLSVTPVPLDCEGLAVAAIPKGVASPKLIHVSPSHQYPTGTVMSLPRRIELIAYAAKRKSWIVEDDYDSDYRFAGQPLSPLQAIDTTGRVIYTGTFSKVLHPSMRVGYMVVPAHLVDVFRAAKRAMNRGTNTLIQAALSDFIHDGHLHRHLRRMRVLYHARQQTLLKAIRDHLDAVMQVEECDTGLHLVGWLRTGFTEPAVTATAARLGLALMPMRSFCIRRRLPAGVLLGYAPYTENEIRRSVARLSRELAG